MIAIRFQAKMLQVIAAALIVVDGGLRLSRAEDPTYLEVALFTSDSQIYEDDGLSYKVLIKNVFRSTVTISGPTLQPRYLCVVESRSGNGEWQVVWDDFYNGADCSVSGPIQIASGSTWAEYGSVFQTKGKKQVFPTAGKYELRASVRSVIGNFRSKPVAINVQAWPKSEPRLDPRFAPLGHTVLHCMTSSLEDRLEHLSEVCGRHQKGGVAKSLKLFLDLASLERDGAVAGKAATRAEAFKVLSPGMDEVRRDQLAFLLGYSARQAKQWKDVEALLEELKVESAERRSLQGGLDGAIQTGAYRGR